MFLHSNLLVFCEPGTTDFEYNIYIYVYLVPGIIAIPPWRQLPALLWGKAARTSSPCCVWFPVSALDALDALYVRHTFYCLFLGSSASICYYDVFYFLPFPFFYFILFITSTLFFSIASGLSYAWVLLLLLPSDNIIAKAPFRYEYPFVKQRYYCSISSKTLCQQFPCALPHIFLFSCCRYSLLYSTSTLHPQVIRRSPPDSSSLPLAWALIALAGWLVDIFRPPPPPPGERTYSLTSRACVLRIKLISDVATHLHLAQTVSVPIFPLLEGRPLSCCGHKLRDRGTYTLQKQKEGDLTTQLPDGKQQKKKQLAVEKVLTSHFG